MTGERFRFSNKTSWFMIKIFQIEVKRYNENRLIYLRKKFYSRYFIFFDPEAYQGRNLQKKFSDNLHNTSKNLITFEMSFMSSGNVNGFSTLVSSRNFLMYRFGRLF